MRRRIEPSTSPPAAVTVGNPFPPNGTVIIARRENDGGLNLSSIADADRRPLLTLLLGDRPALVVTCHQIMDLTRTDLCMIARFANANGMQLILLAAAPWHQWIIAQSHISAYHPPRTYYALPVPELAGLLGVRVSLEDVMAEGSLRNGLCVVRNGDVQALWVGEDVDTPHALETVI